MLLFGFGLAELEKSLRQSSACAAEPFKDHFA